MPRLIDADALLMDNTWAFYDRFGNKTSAGFAIEEAPTVDAEPVVRCKDCKHREVQVDGVFRYEMCGIRSEIINLEGYCHMGERREDGNNNNN